MKISIEDYNSEWPKDYEQTADILKIILGKLHPKIEHIGSSSVPKLAAKPINDMMVGIENLNQLNESIAPMIQEGYIYYESFNSMMPFRRLYIGLKDKNINKQFQPIYSEKDIIPHTEIHKHKITHIHIWQYGTAAWNRHIGFRDYLRTHPKVCEKYQQLKKELSMRDWKDGNDYNTGKSDFLKTVEKNAILWYQKISK